MKHDDDDDDDHELDHDTYATRLRALQIELVKLQRHVIRENGRLLILLEGRDAAGKDGVIKRITAHLSPRETRVVALGKPTERDRTSWYFRRYVTHLPAGGEIVLFNRSWYNRAGVEQVMGFCTEPEYNQFMETVTDFEQLLTQSGTVIRKYYLDISQGEQKRRLEKRRKDPLTQWKVSPIDDVAVKHWTAYSQARDAMLARTHHLTAPWTVVHTDDKRRARLNLITNLLARSSYDHKDASVLRPDPRVVFEYEDACHEAGLLAE